MANSEILRLFSTTLELLTEAELSRLVFIEQNTVSELTDDQKTVVYTIANRFYKNPTATERGLLIDALEMATVKGKPKKVLKVSPGSDFALKIVKPVEDNYTGFKLVARNDATNALISNAGHDGTNEPIQYLHLVDLDASAYSIIKVRVQLEEYDLDGFANGEGVRKLSDIFIITDNEIDTE